MFSFIFSTETCKEIFKEWMGKIGNRASENKICIGIVKGIKKILSSIGLLLVLEECQK